MNPNSGLANVWSQTLCEVTQPSVAATCSSIASVLQDVARVDVPSGGVKLGLQGICPYYTRVWRLETPNSILKLLSLSSLGYLDENDQWVATMPHILASSLNATSLSKASNGGDVISAGDFIANYNELTGGVNRESKKVAMENQREHTLKLISFSTWFQLFDKRDQSLVKLANLRSHLRKHQRKLRTSLCNFGCLAPDEDVAMILAEAEIVAIGQLVELASETSSRLAASGSKGSV